MERIVIHQAHFLPWLPYFSLLASTDIHVVLDDVQYKPRYFINRTKIRYNSTKHLQWITVPNNGTQSSLSKNVRIIRDKNYNKVVHKIIAEYNNAPYFHYWKYFENILNDRTITSIISLDIKLIKLIFNLLEIEAPRFIFSSHILKGERVNCRTQRFKLICEKLGSNIILSGIGKSSEVHDVKMLKHNGINLKGMNKEILCSNTIIEGLSIIDSLFCEGVEKTKNLTCKISRFGYC